MTQLISGALDQRENAITPTIEFGVPGPHQQQGFILRATRLETLVWDLENEVASTSRIWRDEHGAWWMAASYFDSVIQIVLRSFSSVLVMNHGEHDRLYSRDGRTMLQERLF
jgi:hypothetical protein